MHGKLTVISTFIRLILDGPASIATDEVDDEGEGPPSRILSSFIAILAVAPLEYLCRLSLSLVFSL